jgi:hypothetical protein
MELVAILTIEVFLTSAISALERAKRKRILELWISGQLTMTQLLWLKKQPWFARAFKHVTVPQEKKND